MDGEPVCGVDFCDNCGDCMYCYGGELCVVSADDEHVWFPTDPGEVDGE